MIVSPIKAAEAAAFMSLDLATLTKDDLSKAYREKAKAAHPDTGAPLENWARLSWAVNVLSHWLSSRPSRPVERAVASGPTCIKCGGAGRLKVAGRRFGAPLTIQCDTCKGIGTLEAQEDDQD